MYPFLVGSCTHNTVSFGLMASYDFHTVHAAPIWCHMTPTWGHMAPIHHVAPIQNHSAPICCTGLPCGAFSTHTVKCTSHMPTYNTKCLRSHSHTLHLPNSSQLVHRTPIWCLWLPHGSHMAHVAPVWCIQLCAYGAHMWHLPPIWCHIAPIRSVGNSIKEGIVAQE
jgi:hypothetical protein